MTGGCQVMRSDGEMKYGHLADQTPFCKAHPHVTLGFGRETGGMTSWGGSGTRLCRWHDDDCTLQTSVYLDSSIQIMATASLQYA
jgi:hypothetical protein